MRNATAVFGWWCVLGLMACARTAPPQDTTPKTTVVDPLAHDIVVLATGAPTSTPTPTLDLDALLQSPGFARDVAPHLLLGEQSKSSPYNPSADWVLKNRDGIYYLRQPCSEADVETVSPWWKRGAKVRVCKDSHQQERLVDAKGQACGSELLDPQQSPYCGCGPNLVFCYRDRDQLDDVNASMKREVWATIDDIVSHDQPVTDVFLQNATVRDGLADILYVRSAILNGKITEVPADFVADGKKSRRQPREEWVKGQHAGILTTPHLLYFRDNLRDRVQTIYRKMWCVPPPNNGMVTADLILKLKTGSVRVGQAGAEHAWKDLAQRPVCTDCHARMDYGAQFFAGYPEVRVAPFYVESSQLQGKGPVYGNNIDDLRGSTDLVPHAFAELLIGEKEFAACMVNRVVTHVFADGAEPEDHQAVRRAFEQSGTLRAMMKAALLRYQARRQPHVQPQPAASPPTTTATLDSPEVKTILESQCFKCHHEGERDLRGPLTDAQAQAMLEQVAFLAMPKRHGQMPAHVRRVLVEALLQRVYPNVGERAQATPYYQRELRALPVHTLPALMKVARDGQAGDNGPSPYLLSVEADQLQLSPGVATFAAVAALEACDAASDRLACMTQHLDVQRLTSSDATSPRE